MWTQALQEANYPLQWGVVIGASLVAACFDLYQRRIPNLLTGPVMLAGLVWAGVFAGWPGLADSLAACVVLMLPCVLLFVFAGGGAGDAKLMGAIGTWLGLHNGLFVLAGVSLAAIVLALCFALAKRQLLAVLGRIFLIGYSLLFSIAGRKIHKGERAFLPDKTTMQTMPYGLAIFAGTVLAAFGVLIWPAG